MRQTVANLLRITTLVSVIGIGLVAVAARADDALPLEAPQSQAVTTPEGAQLPEFDTLLELRKATPFPLDDPSWMEDPFTVLELEMLEASGDLKSGATRPPAQVTQPRILSRLDMMIEQLEQKCNGSKTGSSSGTNPSKPAEESTLRKGQNREGELRAPDQAGRNWAKLPPKERERILQARDEGFPPGYEDVLADYFRRISRGDDATPAAPPMSPDRAAPSPMAE